MQIFLKFHGVKYEIPQIHLEISFCKVDHFQENQISK